MKFFIKKLLNLQNLFYLLTFLIITPSIIYSKELRIDGTGRNVSGITFSDGSSFRLFTSKGRGEHHLVIMVATVMVHLKLLMRM